MNTNEFVINFIFAICCLNFFIFKVNSSPNLDLESSKVSEHSDSVGEENRVRYIGAVLEYEPYNEWSEDGKGYNIMRNNSKAIVKFAEKAKLYNTDIIITPEYGIPSLNMFEYENNTENFLTFTQYVPDPSLRMVLCEKEEEPNNKYEAIKIISCGSLTNAIYIVVTLAEVVPCSSETIDQPLPWVYEIQKDCPKEGYFLYNTQVVFDRKGAVVARYRKQHLFYELAFTPGPQIDIEAIFITDFNVAFSLQICFDIVYEHPGYANINKYGIRDVAFSKAWFDTLPFYLANSVDNGFSRGPGVNLLASGYHRPEKGNVGSGIFKGYSPDDLPLFTSDENSGNVLLISSIDTVAASSLTLPQIDQNKNGSVRNYSKQPVRHNGDIRLSLKESPNLDARHRKFHYVADLALYTKILMNMDNSQNITNTTVCDQNDFCCSFSYKYSGNQTYYMFVFSGKFNAGGRNGSIEINTCAVVWCQNSDYKTCGQIETDSQVEDAFSYLKISTDSLKFGAISSVYNHRNTRLIDNKVFDIKLQDQYSSLSSVRAVENLLIAAFRGIRIGQEN